MGKFPSRLPISVTGPARPLIWTHRYFYKEKSGEARSQKQSQPGWPSSYEEALRRINYKPQQIVFPIIPWFTFYFRKLDKDRSLPPPWYTHPPHPGKEMRFLRHVSGSLNTSGYKIRSFCHTRISIPVDRRSAGICHTFNSPSVSTESVNKYTIFVWLKHLSILRKSQLQLWTTRDNPNRDWLVPNKLRVVARSTG